MSEDSAKAPQSDRDGTVDISRHSSSNNDRPCQNSASFQHALFQTSCFGRNVCDIPCFGHSSPVFCSSYLSFRDLQYKHLKLSSLLSSRTWQLPEDKVKTDQTSRVPFNHVFHPFVLPSILRAMLPIPLLQ